MLMHQGFGMWCEICEFPIMVVFVWFAVLAVKFGFSELGDFNFFVIFWLIHCKPQCPPP